MPTLNARMRIGAVCLFFVAIGPLVVEEKQASAQTETLPAAIPQPKSEKTGKETVNQLSEGTLERTTVLDVNPSLRLVVLNIGLLQGARIGMPLVVLRGDRVVAELKIVEVRQQICGARIERVEKKVILKAGDTAWVTKSS